MSDRNHDYLSLLQTSLAISEPGPSSPLALDLFAGCGGLALGFEAAGFRTVGFEKDHAACGTYRANLAGDCHCQHLEPGQRLVAGADVIVGGPPCQPFSVGGLQLGPRDARDGFPVFLDAIERYQPKVAVFENVRGMLYKNHSYLEAVVAELEALSYRVEKPRLLNALWFGVPQRRERLFVVAHRGRFEWPAPSFASKPYSAGDALGSLAMSIPNDAKFLTASMDEYVARYEAKSNCIRPRDLHLDSPSRTVTCRNLSGATGDMLRVRLPDGRRRRLTVREGARLQSFPDSFKFSGSVAQQYQQVGNAVPPLLAKAVAVAVRNCLESPIAEESFQRTEPCYARQLTLLDIANAQDVRSE